MDIVIDISFLNDFLALPPGQMLWRFFVVIGWIPIAILFLFAVRIVWLNYIRAKWGSKANFILLAIDIPRDNAQSPLAVENMFTYFAGAHGSINWYEKWFEGKFQLSFSLEIVSIEGYTQFIIRTPEQFRNIVETAVYSQYPDAEITQVDDYVNNVSHHFPNEEWDIAGSEFIMSQNTMYPIKCYEEFEHQMGPIETTFRDPMASLMDLCGSMGPGEQLWYQLILIPIGFDWMDKADEEVDKILKRKKKSKDGILSTLLVWLGEASEAIYSIWGDIEEDKKEDKGLSMMELTPKQKKQVEGLHKKVSKIGFEFKIRVVYMAKPEVKDAVKAFSGFVGFMKQFAALDLNNLKPDVKLTMTKADYFMSNYRLNEKKNRLMSNYIERSDWGGRLPGIMNIEELATVWHFPIGAVVKAPMMQMAPGRKAEAPSTLPLDALSSSKEENASFEEDIFGVSSDNEEKESTEETIKEGGETPTNLPFA